MITVESSLVLDRLKGSDHHKLEGLVSITKLRERNYEQSINTFV